MKSSSVNSHINFLQKSNIHKTLLCSVFPENGETDCLWNTGLCFELMWLFNQADVTTSTPHDSLKSCLRIYCYQQEGYDSKNAQGEMTKKNVGLNTYTQVQNITVDPMTSKKSVQVSNFHVILSKTKSYTNIWQACGKPV